MRNTALKFGGIAGGVMVAMFFLTFLIFGDTPDFDTAEWLGYVSMIAAMSTIFIGIKTYRDKQSNGEISFNNAFQVGFYITLVASLIYVIGWMLYYNTIGSDFMQNYTQYHVEKLKSSGQPEAEITAQIDEMKSFQELYKNPFIMIAITFLEIFPIGLLVTLICAVVLRTRKKAALT